jgi:hypothetical protein
MPDVITTQDMKPQCVLLRFWHLNQPIFWNYQLRAQDTLGSASNIKKSIRWMFWLRVRVNDVQWRRQLDNWRANIHIFVFTDHKNNRLQKKLIMQNTKIWIFAPSPQLSSWRRHWWCVRLSMRSPTVYGKKLLRRSHTMLGGGKGK